MILDVPISIKDLLISIPEKIFPTITTTITTILPIYKKCKNCGYHFEVNSPVNIRCPKCGSINTQIQ